MKTKHILLNRAREAANNTARPSKDPRDIAKLNFETLSKVRDKLNARTLDNRATPQHMELLQALNALPRTMPVAVRCEGTTEAAHNFVWNDFTTRINAAMPSIEKLRRQAGII